jgi:hypothetical protein
MAAEVPSKRERLLKVGVLTLLILAGLFLLYTLFVKKSSATGTQTASGTQSGTAKPVVEYIPTTGDSFTTIASTQTNSNNSLTGSPVSITGPSTTNSPSTTNTTTTTINNPPPPPSPVGGGPPVHLPPGPDQHGPPTHVPPPPPPRYATYTVKAGDTLTKIAARYHLNWQTLYAIPQNKVVIDQWAARFHYPVSKAPPDNIFVGEQILIPQG